LFPSLFTGSITLSSMCLAVAVYTATQSHREGNPRPVRYMLSCYVAAVAGCLQVMTTAFCGIFYLNGSPGVETVLLLTMVAIGAMLVFAVGDAIVP
jgi:hypothetical protein